ncbi:MAG: hypothetical protein KDA53_05965 [Hyphomonas sp.]|nr:hypothetical protein [Hyphomonas sp.]
MKLRSTCAALLLATAIAACATTPEPDAPPEPVTLSDEEFVPLRKAARSESTQPKREAALTALIARDDLTDRQRAEAYYERGFLRGNYVRDDVWAYPQCSVVDYMKMEELAPDHPWVPNMQKDREYQFSRFKYDTFNTAPQECKDAAAEAFNKVHS